MSKIPLPQRSYLDSARKQQCASWQQQGYGGTTWPLPEGDALLHFTTDSAWEGIIDLREWFARVMPSMAALADEAYTLQQLQNLFMNSHQPLAVATLPPELRYQQIISQRFITAEQCPQIQMMLTTTEGRIWLTSIDQQLNPHTPQAKFCASRVPVTLQLVIGRSRLTFARFKQVQFGDVLLITTTTSDVYIANQLIGRFYQHEGGYMLEKTDENSGDIAQLEAQNTPQEAVSHLRATAHIPVTLEFVLQRKTVSIAELEAFYQGALIPCEPDAEKQIDIVANGMTIARGQMVWIDDRAGVEINHLSQGAGNGDR